jgi:hypothetical protein
MYPDWNNSRNALGLGCDLVRQVISMETLHATGAKHVKRCAAAVRHFRKLVESWYKEGFVALDDVQEALEPLYAVFIRAAYLSNAGMALNVLRKMLIVIRRNKKAARELGFNVTKAWDRGVPQDELRTLVYDIEHWLYYGPGHDANVDRLKMKWRLRDVLAANGGLLPSMDVRKAFEAIWLAGEHEVAYRTWLGEVT